MRANFLLSFIAAMASMWLVLRHHVVGRETPAPALAPRRQGDRG